MVDAFIIRHLLSDEASLSTYVSGGAVTAEDVKRRLLLLERKSNTDLPDQYYRLAVRKQLGNLDTLARLLEEGLFRLSDHFLQLQGNIVHVKPALFNTWQAILPLMPPLLLQAAYWTRNFPGPDEGLPSLQTYLDSYVHPNCKHSCLPFPFVDALEQWMNKHNGLFDLHMHLNGATETDLAWQDFLKAPTKVYRYLQTAVADEKVREQLEQETLSLTPKGFFDLLRTARRIRQVFFDIVFPAYALKVYPPTTQALLAQLTDSRTTAINDSPKHPFRSLFSNKQRDLPDVCAEGLMYVIVLNRLRAGQTQHLASLFHFYVLILGLANRLLVQQVHQYGFEQFQKITLNGLREHSEETFRTRFFQLQGNRLRNLHFLEGRFSPKDSEAKNAALIAGINMGWAALVKEMKKEGRPLPKLQLVAHFIKRADSDRYANVRHERLRRDVWKRAKILALQFPQSAYKNLLAGVDAAASEFDAPPEVFAPAFRYLRRKNVKHFTYHAGEDFYHILSGLRAIYEAVDFCGLGEKDRIGHATAAGVNTSMWREKVGEKIYMKRGDWLDDLVFALFFIQDIPVTELTHLLPAIKKEIDRHLYHVYVRGATLDELVAAWQSRKYCPILLFAGGYSTAHALTVFNFDEWKEVEALGLSTGVRNVLSEYHSAAGRSRYEQVIEVDTFDVFSPADLAVLQRALLKLLADKKVVIETLPTSNVRIGHYSEYATYHLWNWRNWKQDGNPVPEIVVGTDDTGIFATSIFNEYAHLFCCLLGQTDEVRATEYVKELHINAQAFRFVP